MPEATTTTPMTSAQSLRHKPLIDDLVATGSLRTKSNKRKAKREDDARDGYVDSKSSRKILKIGRDLVEEDQEASRSALPSSEFNFESRPRDDDDSDEDARPQGEEAWGDENEEVVDEVVS